MAAWSFEQNLSSHGATGPQLLKEEPTCVNPEWFLSIDAFDLLLELQKGF